VRCRRVVAKFRLAFAVATFVPPRADIWVTPEIYEFVMRGSGVRILFAHQKNPKLIVHHLDKSLIDQLAEIGLKPVHIGRVAISHTHGDHIGDVGLFPNSTIVMQKAEYSWIHSPNGAERQRKSIDGAGA
jgi:metal-dependent hydrolase (beta-lactamase superfamily II)